MGLGMPTMPANNNNQGPSSSNPTGSPGAGGGPRGNDPGKPNGTYSPPAQGQLTVDPYVQWYKGSMGIAGAQYQQALANSNTQQSQGYARYSSGINGLNANAGFDRAYLHNDRNRLAADYGLYDAKNQNINDQFGVSQRRFNDQLGQNQDRRGLAGRQFDLSTTGANNQYRSNIDAALLQFDRTSRAQRSDATARGATLTPGYGADQSETVRARDLSTRDAGYGRDQAIGGATLARDATMNDLAYADRANQRAYDGDTSNYKLAQEQQKRERTYLDNLAGDYGVKAEQIEDALKRGAENLGMSWQETLTALAQDRSNAGTSYLAAGQAATLQLLSAATNTSMANALGAQRQSQPTWDGTKYQSGNPNPQLPAGTKDDGGRTIGPPVMANDPRAA
jgi:hypothetical protein